MSDKSVRECHESMLSVGDGNFWTRLTQKLAVSRTRTMLYARFSHSRCGNGARREVVGMGTSMNVDSLITKLEITARVLCGSCIGIQLQTGIYMSLTGSHKLGIITVRVSALACASGLPFAGVVAHGPRVIEFWLASISAFAVP